MSAAETIWRKYLLFLSLSHLSLRDIKSFISGSTLDQIDHLRPPRRIPNKIRNENKNIFILPIILVGWFGLGWVGLASSHYLGVTEEAGDDCWLLFLSGSAPD